MICDSDTNVRHERLKVVNREKRGGALEMCCDETGGVCV